MIFFHQDAALPGIQFRRSLVEANGTAPAAADPLKQPASELPDTSGGLPF